MSFQRNSRPQGGTIMEDNYWGQFVTRNSFNGRNRLRNNGYLRAFSNNFEPFMDSLDYPPRFRDNFYDNYSDGISSNHDYPGFNHPGFGDYGDKCEHAAPSWKRRKFSASAWGDTGRAYFPANGYEFGAGVARMNPDATTSNPSCKRGRSKLGDDEPVFLSRDEIERHSPSRKDGIDVLRETHLRYSYCGFLQSLGLRLELPQTTIGTAMVLCHRFFVRRSHACHDRFLIATAALFLSAKSEETPRPLNNVLRASSELYHKQDMSLLSYLLPVDWFEQYRERVLEAENMILATLNFELNVQHPYAPLTSTLNKLGLSQSVLVLALNLVSEGRSLPIGLDLPLSNELVWNVEIEIDSSNVFTVDKRWVAKLALASVQTTSYRRRSCLSRWQIPTHGSRFESEYLARIPNNTGDSSRCVSTIDGAILKWYQRGSSA